MSENVQTMSENEQTDMNEDGYEEPSLTQLLQVLLADREEER